MLRPFVVVLCTATAMLAAPAALPAQAKLPPVRPLGAVEHTAKEVLGAVSATRALSDGRVLVNDIMSRRVLLFDPTLSSFSVVADTTSATANAYSSRFAGLIAYRGDSSLFVDPTSLSMLVIAPTGQVARVMSIPRPNDAGSLVGGPNGTPGFDGQGRLVYRGSSQFRFAGPGGPGGAPGNRPAAPPAGGRAGVPRLPEFPDSVPLVRVELATRKLDTLSFLKVARTRMSMSQDTSGRTTMTAVIHPLPVVDDWAVMSDGSVAIVRGLDYHVDWVRGDAAPVASGKIPFEWRRLDDSAKVAFIDSTRAAMEKLRAQNNAQRAAGGQGPLVLGPGAEGSMAGMERVMVFQGRGGSPGGGDGPRARNEAGGGPPANFTIPPLQFVEPTELPDYAPPFSAGAARADMDGNLWIRTTIAVNGAPVYDIVGALGELLDRVALPAGRVIAGFGPGGVVYMGVRGTAGVRLEQARRTAVVGSGK